MGSLPVAEVGVQGVPFTLSREASSSTGSIAHMRNDVRGELVVDMAGSGHLLVPTLLCVAVVLDAFGNRQRGAQPDMPVSRVHRLSHAVCPVCWVLHIFVGGRNPYRHGRWDSTVLRGCQAARFPCAPVVFPQLV